MPNKISAGATVNFTLKIANPVSSTVSSSDLLIEIWSSGKLVAKASPITSVLTFGCDKGCRTCPNTHETCSACEFGFTLLTGVCSSLSVASLTGNMPPFLFLGLAILGF
jgi:hypothetical protein